MNHQLKPGDLCLIVGARRAVHNIGKTVTLVEFVPADRWFMLRGISWRVEEPVWIVEGDSVRCYNVTRTRKLKGVAVVRPQHLMPLRNNGEDFNIEGCFDKTIDAPKSVTPPLVGEQQ